MLRMDCVRSDLPLFFMRTHKSKRSTIAKSDGLIASSSGNELPLIQQGDHLLIDARILHKSLKVGRDFATWIKNRIEEYGFEPNKDFFSDISPKVGKTSGRPQIEVHLTIDTAKELAMVERNEIGRSIRRYFIQKEKEARAISHLPKEAGLFKGLKPKRVNDRILFPYKEILIRCGYKASSNGNRRHRYWMHFVKEDNHLFVTEEFSLHLFRQKQVINNRVVMVNMQSVLPLNFGDPKQLSV